VKSPVDSITIWTPSLAHGSSAGVLALTTAISRLVDDEHVGVGLIGVDFFELTVPPKRPWIESYLSR